MKKLFPQFCLQSCFFMSVRLWGVAGMCESTVEIISRGVIAISETKKRKIGDENLSLYVRCDRVSGYNSYNLSAISISTLQ